MLVRAKEARLTGSRVTHTTSLYTVTLTAVELSLLGTRATYSFNWHLQSLTVVRCVHALTLTNILVILAGLLRWAVARSVGCRPLPARSRRSSPSKKTPESSKSLRKRRQGTQNSHKERTQHKRMARFEQQAPPEVGVNKGPLGSARGPLLAGVRGRSPRRALHAMACAGHAG